jgi:hypothetical protein
MNFTKLIKASKIVAVILLLLALGIFAFSFLSGKRFKVNITSYKNYIEAINEELAKHGKDTLEISSNNLWTDKSLTIITSFENAVSNKIDSLIKKDKITINDSLAIKVYINAFISIDSSNTQRFFIKCDSVKTIFPKLIGLEEQSYDDNYYASIGSYLNKIDPSFITKYPYYPFIKQTISTDTLNKISIVLLLLAAIVAGIIYLLGINENERRAQENRKEALQKIVENPKEIKRSWDMAQLTLEQYYRRNLNQINWIFFTSIGVMIAGFLLIAFGLASNIQNQKNNIQLISIGSGIITEFIGATFIFIYNSTMKQALEYTHSLEKVNNVGMSVTILDSVEKDDQNEIKLEEAKIEIAKLLIQKST